MQVEFLSIQMYRHPNTDVTSFTQYMETTFTEMNKDKYNIFIMGDFSIDLLQYDTHNKVCSPLEWSFIISIDTSWDWFQRTYVLITAGKNLSSNWLIM